MGNACRTVKEVPLFERTLLAFDDGDAFAVQDEEVLLDGLRVVAAVRLAGLQDLDVHAGIRPGCVLGLPVNLRGPARVAPSGRVGQVDDDGPVHASQDSAAATSATGTAGCERPPGTGRQRLATKTGGPYVKLAVRCPA